MLPETGFVNAVVITWGWVVRRTALRGEVIVKQPVHVLVLAALRAEMNGERVHGLIIAPRGEDIDLAARGLHTDALGGEAQRPVLVRFLAFMTGVANKLDHSGNLAKLRWREA